MPLHPGAPFGPYEVLAPLGAGGMGEVYRARDLKLQREVALKVLPDAVARDADRRARFERESHVLAALNHPHIAGIYGVAEEQGVTALVLELVEGPTLEQRLADGALPLEETAAIARQVAEALEAAHEAGIVHRDLKPANIKLRPDGSVKVLDFGLAKAIGAHSAIAAERAHSPTVTADATAAGLILGTAAYMAPEQARGRTVDKRADIWAFGVVLWEMLTGRPLFGGETLTDTLAAVLTREIDWSQLPGSTPPALVDLLRRCLERDPKKRLRDIGDVRLDDSALATASAVGPAPSTARRWWLWGLAMSAALAAGVAIGRIGPGVVAGPPAREVRFTFPADDPSSAAISPDGSMAVVASGGPLRVRDLVGVSLRELSGTDGAVKPFWSPDSRTIGFGRAGRLWRVSSDRGRAGRRLRPARGQLGSGRRRRLAARRHDRLHDRRLAAHARAGGRRRPRAASDCRRRGRAALPLRACAARGAWPAVRRASRVRAGHARGLRGRHAARSCCTRPVR